MKVMRLSWYIFVAQWILKIYNSKLRVGKNGGKIFTKGISFNIFSKEYCIGNPELDNLTDDIPYMTLYAK